MATSSIDDVLAQLDAIIALAVEEEDRRGYFAVVYRLVTARIKEGIETGFFDDPERMVRFDGLFADRYLDAVAAQRRGGRPTASWQLTFDAGARARPLVLQHLLVGINAHINLDLGVAAARTAPGDALGELRADYLRVNAILAAMIQSIQADLRRISPWLGLLDLVGARTQTEVVRFSIVTARAGAWRFATRLAAAEEDAWPAMIAERDRRVAQVGERVLRPGGWLAPALLVLRLRESGDVGENLRALLGASPPSWQHVAAVLDESPTP